MPATSTMPEREAIHEVLVIAWHPQTYWAPRCDSFTCRREFVSLDHKPRRSNRDSVEAAGIEAGDSGRRANELAFVELSDRALGARRRSVSLAGLESQGGA